MAGIGSTHVSEGPQTPGFGPMAECPPSKSRPTELQIRPESRVSFEPYTISVMSKVSAAREVPRCRPPPPGVHLQVLDQVALGEVLDQP